MLFEKVGAGTYRPDGILTAKFSQHLFNFDIKQMRAVLRILPNGAAVLSFEGNPVESHSKDYQKNQGAHSKVRLSCQARPRWLGVSLT